MGMVVRTNTMSANAYRQLGMNNSAVSKSLEKLSSGFRINRAGDDASGLAISEKMKAQISGLEQASANSQDGISLVQTAEGALTEVHSMLNRMTELATKSANGTIQDKVDRDSIQTEVDALKTEITRIAKTTNFNGINLLDGSLGASAKMTQTAGTDLIPDPAGQPAKAAVYTIDFAGFTATAGQTVIYNGVTATEGTTAGFAAANTATQNTAAVAAAWGADAAFSDYNVTASGTTITLTAKTAGVDADSATMKTTMTGTATITSKAVTETVAGAAATGNPTPAKGAETKLDYTGKVGSDVIGTTVKIGSKTYEFVATGGAVSEAGNVAVTLAANATATDIASGLTTAVKTDTAFYDANAAGKYNVTSAAGVVTMTSNTTGAASTAAAVKQTGGGLSLQVGDTNDSFNKVNISVEDLSATGLGIANLDVSSQTTAASSISTIKTAINTVSTNRGNLGALQNRLEHAINNLDTTAENMTSANSRIRDTDMAKEMMQYTKMNILTQAAQAMLAQANQNPQSILQLLQ